MNTLLVICLGEKAGSDKNTVDEHLYTPAMVFQISKHPSFDRQHGLAWLRSPESLVYFHIRDDLLVGGNASNLNIVLHLSIVPQSGISCI